LDQCLGTLPEPLVPLRTHPTYRVRHSFDAPIQHPEAIELITVDLIDQLCRSVQRSERGISRIRWTAERTHARPLVVTFDLSIPTRQRDQLWALLHPHLERLPIEMSGHGFGNARKRSKRRRTQRHAGHDGHAGERDNPVPAGETTLRVASDGIDAIVLEALRTLSVPHHQVGLMPTGLQQAACNRASWSRLSDGMPNETQHLAPTALDPAALACADRISARLGRQRVLCGAHQASHEPERAWERVPWDAVLKVGGQFGQGITRDRHGITMGSHEAYGGREGASLPPHAPRGDRPPWLLDPPQLVLVTRGATEDRPSLPVFQWRFQWRGHLYRIIDTDGWECLDGTWWDRTPTTAGERPSRRWYCRATCTDGSVFWMYSVTSVGAERPRMFDIEDEHRAAAPDETPSGTTTRDTIPSNTRAWWLHGGWF
jgi:hypothetical protein